MAGEGDGFDPLSEDSRISRLQERLNKAEAEEKVRTGTIATPESDKNYQLGNRVLAELLGGMIGGALIGWVIDRFAGTSPWGLIILLFLGIVVAFRNIIRISNQRPKQ